jgi:predicted RNase H-like HicB family nuclease
LFDTQIAYGILTLEGKMLKKIMEIKKIFKNGKKIACQAKAAINCLEYKDRNTFIAHCLEFDLLAQGETQEEARRNLADLIKTHIQFAIEKDVEEKSLFHPAPPQYWKILHDMQSRIARQSFLRRGRISVQDILNDMHCTYAHI